MTERKQIIPVPKQESKRDLKYEQVVAVLQLTPEQQAQIKAATGLDLTQLELTKVELDLIASPAGYDAPGAAMS